MSHKKSCIDSYILCYDVGCPTRHPDGFTIYKVTQQMISVDALEKNIQETVTWKRYNDFKKLHKAMFSLHRALHRREEFPEFVKAQLFNRFDSSVIEERRRSAQDLLNFVGQRPYLTASAVFKQFFQDAQPVLLTQKPSSDVLKPTKLDVGAESTATESSPDDACGTSLVEPLPVSSSPAASPSHASKSSVENLLKEPQVDSDAVTLGGIWLHRQHQEDVNSIDDGLDEDDIGLDYEHCPQPVLNCDTSTTVSRCLEKSDIAVFDSLFTTSTADTLMSTSNLELLSAITLDAAVAEPEPAAEIIENSSSVPVTREDCSEDDLDGQLTSDDAADEQDARPTTGSVIESGRGDLAVSPVHRNPPVVSSSSSSSHIPSLLRAGASLAKSKLLLPWKTNNSSALPAPDVQTEYILEAAKIISQAQEYEMNENYPAAYCHYRSGIEALVKGVQKDTNKERQHAVGIKMNKYLLKADELYQTHLASSTGQQTWNRWGAESETEVDASTALLRAPAALLKNFRVIGIINGVMLVVDTETEGTFVIKVLHKSCTEPGGKSIVPTHLPYMITLIRFYETETAIYLLLQHAAGGRLWSYVGAYLNQCSDASPDVLPSPEQQPCLNRSVHHTDVGSKGSHLESTSTEGECDQQPGTISSTVPLQSELSINEADCLEDNVDDTTTGMAVSDFRSPGFQEILKSARPEMQYFSIDSGDSGSVSRQISCASEASIPKDVPENEVSQTVSGSQTSESGSYAGNVLEDVDVSSHIGGITATEELSIYDRHDRSDDKNMTRSLSVTIDSSQVVELTGASKSPHKSSMMLRLGSQERSYESAGRRRHRTLSSAFGELDLASGTDLRGPSTPHRTSVRLPESCVRQWAAEMVVAISRLHSLGIICRDLRPANVLLGDRGHILLTYFSRWNSVDWRLNEQAVDDLYCAPEVTGVAPVTTACDWWSLGALLFELLTGQSLRSCHPAGITSHSSLVLPDDISCEAQSLLRELLRHNASERLGGGAGGSDDIRAHPFFSGILWNNLLG